MQRLFIGGVPYDLDEQGLAAFFAENGVQAHGVKIAKDKETKQPRGFGFADVENAAEAIELLKGKYCNGRSMRIEPASTQPGQDRKPGSFRPPQNRGYSNDREDGVDDRKERGYTHGGRHREGGR